ncbi:SpaA isopeptide-forming pilin-related protein [Bifidobacterium gallicum]|uniref:LPXTG-motif cell wall anchor domain protein n=1 Tax=Bifidobacterium gallicum DSM 20093 = LMG 11596 TaxID=561180 RepID=D1NUK5_9BIFI|nr:SpaA isopeptide-forming pilin-related protein [Bifidobacterium gallicum]EFA22506.1 LPXTG-motif cell wall anchor domain protein [Bifidobacterium gallicum DSM 20093 = LMG 11596]KFI59328.1 putative surface-anchored fimbrial subunit [Bifidobacterium gallicum DSM 20093 = LMG 11596]
MTNNTTGALRRQPRVYAALTALAMMLATAVPALLPRTAQANDPVAGICVPEDITLGDGTDGGTVDTGVATWVGRDMYVGAPKAGITNYGRNSNEINGSYAVEAEGTTLVGGKLAINSKKASWSNRGFRFGIVGFGAQYRPAAGSDALVVAGTNSNITLTGTSNNGSQTVDTNALGWGRNARGWVGTLKSGEWNYDARISGNKSQTVYDYSNQWFDSVYSDNAADVPASQVLWNQSNPLSNVKLNGANGATADYTNNTETIQKLSQTLAAIPATEDAATPKVENAGTYDNGSLNGTYTYKKYNSDDGVYIGANITFSNDGGKREKLIVFDGKNTDAKTIVFFLDGSQLADGNDYNGTSFMFKNIPDNASIIVNVSGSAPISFHNGWRFWWNGLQIGNGYYLKSNNPAIQKAYERAAQAIMWNFYETSYLKIEGGVVTDGQGVAWANTGQPNDQKVTVNDDPAAAMIGSILVPNGSFEDHVTTNGRVWVGQDFMMYNPSVARNFGPGVGEGDSASILDMDQERHNFPWTGSLHSECSTIAWNKVDESGKLLGGTRWGVYGSLEDAKNRSNGIYPNVADNNIPSGDWNLEDGKFRVNSLVPGADYYIREIETVTGYKLNDNIYVINAANKGDVANTAIKAVYDGQGNALTGDNADKGLANVSPADSSNPIGIVNPTEGGLVNWGKYAEGSSQPYKGLEGSEWNLQKDGDSESWTITDNTLAVAGLKVFHGETLVADSETGEIGAVVDVAEFQQLQLNATVLPASAVQKVTWSSDNEKVHVNDGLINVTEYPGDDVQVHITVTTVDLDASGNPISVTIPLRITQATVESLTVKKGNDVVAPNETIDMNVDDTVKLTASVEPAYLHPTFTWTSSNPGVVTVDANGTVHAEGEGTADVTVSCKGKTQTIRFLVAPNQYPLTVYIQWPGAKPTFYWYDAPGESGPEWGVAPYMDPVDSCGNNWYSYNLPFGSGKEFSFIISDDHNGEKKYAMSLSDTNEFTGLEPPGGTQGKYTAVKAMGNMRAYMIQNGELSVGAPSCAAVTPSRAKALSVAPQSMFTQQDLHVSSKPLNEVGAETILRARKAQMRDAAKDSTPMDQNSRPGEFSLALENGTYTLWEKTAPAGYTINPTRYRFTITDGVVEWIGDQKPSIVGAVGWIADSPTTVSWQKTDADNDELLGGSQWGIYEKIDGAVQVEPIQLIEDCVANDAAACATRYANQKYYDANPAKGKFKVSKLPSGSYVLKEIEAPTGYELLENGYPFKIDTTSTNENDVNIEIGALKNQRTLGSVTWSKVDAEDTSKLLAGSEWTLTYKKGTEDQVVLNIEDCNSKSGCEALPADGAAWNATGGNVVYDFNGTFSIKNLPWGSYELVETKAPDGYYLDATEHKFTVGPDTNETVETIKLNWDLGSIRNEPGVVLPSAGGDGQAVWVMLAGALVLLMGMGCAVIVNRRRV